LIFGAGGHARVIASLLGDVTARFVVQNPASPVELAEADVLSKIESYRDARFYIGIGDNGIRTRIFDALARAGIVLSNCIAPTAFIAPGARLGAGVTVCPGAAVMAGAVVGDNVIVNTLSSVDHDCRIGEHSQITAGVTLGGGVTMGKSCFVGLKAAILPGVTIGNGVVVMAGSLVTAEQPDNVMVGGTPARVIKRL
jgi:UDP-perosamine 4-acetyltransferase